jgi:hypothetical protein
MLICWMESRASERRKKKGEHKQPRLRVTIKSRVFLHWQSARTSNAKMCMLLRDSAWGIRQLTQRGKGIFRKRPLLKQKRELHVTHQAIVMLSFFASVFNVFFFRRSFLLFLATLFVLP